jgi:hypothetical protein
MSAKLKYSIPDLGKMIKSSKAGIKKDSERLLKKI